ncbi:MAG: aldehyde dehydrogenase family protein [Porticoccaceae bacterium]
MDFKLLIDGELVNGASQRDIVNPATEAVIAASPVADDSQLKAAVAAARRAQPSWAGLAIEQRAECLRSFAAAVAGHEADIARLITLEVGRPIALSHFEVQLVLKSCAYYSAQRLDPEVLLDDKNIKVAVHRVPIGVVAAILPWNAPLYLAINKMAPALMAGNTIVLKPAPTTPLATLKLAELASRIFPRGVVNVLADDNDLGPALVRHPDIDKIAFTGSSATGRQILAAAASDLKRVTLELSGNDAAIVLEDVDAKAVAPALVFGAFFNSGQICAVIKRLYVHEAVHDALCAEMAEVLAQAVTGNGLDPGSHYGPIQNREQFEKVKVFLEEARVTGRIICGGGVPDRPGYFIEPTIVCDLEDGDRLVDEEPFGPILPVIRFDDIDDAVNRANRSPYGLGASVWSADPARAEAIGKRLDAGTVWINQHCAIDPAIPFPTSKQSGLGVEAGREGLLEYTNIKVFNINTGG